MFLPKHNDLRPHQQLGNSHNIVLDFEVAMKTDMHCWFTVYPPITHLINADYKY